MFNPAKIGSLELQNRFIRSATAEFIANDDNGTLVEDYYELYSRLSLGEIGLIIQGHLYVLDEGKAHDNMAGISHDFHLNGLKRLVDTVHKTNENSKIAAQLNHGGAFSVSKKAPSLREGKELKILTSDEIENIIQSFREAALRVKKTGYDAVQIHAAHGYLISQFLSDRTNQREDSWGGNLENKAQLLLSVYQVIRSSVGNHFPVLVKMNGSDDPSPGFSNEEASVVAKWLADEGIDAIEISGMKSTRTFKIEEEAYFSSNARKIKEKIGDTPVILVGGVRTMDKISQLLYEFDFISMCRPFIREPDLIKKFKEGKPRADCQSCSQCIRNKIVMKCSRLDKTEENNNSHGN